MDECKYCNEVKELKEGILKGIIAENSSFFARLDRHPVSKGHVLIISREHRANIFELPLGELMDYGKILADVKMVLDEEYHPDGYNVGSNIGKAAGQTKFHMHVHVIPRYDGDVEDPVGGVRNVIPGKGNYKKK